MLYQCAYKFPQPFEICNCLIVVASRLIRVGTRVSTWPLFHFRPVFMATTLKRTGVSAYRGMVVCKAQPATWSKDTMLVRMVEENGASTVFILTDAAKAQFGICEQWRIYEFKVNGASVKKGAGIERFGAGGVYEVVMKFEAKDFKLSEKPFPLAY